MLGSQLRFRGKFPIGPQVRPTAVRQMPFANESRRIPGTFELFSKRHPFQRQMPQPEGSDQLRPWFLKLGACPQRDW